MHRRRETRRTRSAQGGGGAERARCLISKNYGQRTPGRMSLFFPSLGFSLTPSYTPLELIRVPASSRGQGRQQGGLLFSSSTKDILYSTSRWMLLLLLLDIDYLPFSSIYLPLYPRNAETKYADEFLLESFQLFLTKTTLLAASSGMNNNFPSLKHICVWSNLIFHRNLVGLGIALVNPYNQANPPNLQKPTKYSN